MSHSITEIRHEVDHLKVKVDGDGNGIKGLVRRADHIESRQDNVDRFMARIEKLLWGIAAAVILQIVMGQLKYTYGGGATPQPVTHSQPPSTSTAAMPTNSPDAAN